MLSIGSIQLDVPFAQAALSGYSDVAMRRLAREYGCPYSINEVVLDKFVATGGKKMRRMLALARDEHPVGGQLMGSEPEEFAAAANVLISLGYDVVDINFGCPVKKVLGRGRGGFLLSTPDQAKAIIRRVHGEVAGRVPVTVKMRRGMDRSSESEQNFFAILDTAFETGVAAVTVHGRTVAQRYVGRSDWGFLARVKRHVGDRTIIGSGDLFTAEDCMRMLRETGVDGCSIARGAIGNPFIFEEVRAMYSGKPLPPPPSIVRQREVIEQHFRLMTEVYGEENALRLFRKFGVRYSELHPLWEDVKMAFVNVRCADSWRAMLDRWYSRDGDYPPVVRRTRPEALVSAGAVLHCEEEKTDES